MVNWLNGGMEWWIGRWWCDEVLKWWNDGVMERWGGGRVGWWNDGVLE